MFKHLFLKFVDIRFEQLIVYRVDAKIDVAKIIVFGKVLQASLDILPEKAGNLS